MFGLLFEAEHCVAIMVVGKIARSENSFLGLDDRAASTHAYVRSSVPLPLTIREISDTANSGCVKATNVDTTVAKITKRESKRAGSTLADAWINSCLAGTRGSISMRTVMKLTAMYDSVIGSILEN